LRAKYLWTDEVLQVFVDESRPVNLLSTMKMAVCSLLLSTMKMAVCLTLLAGSAHAFSPAALGLSPKSLRHAAPIETRTFVPTPSPTLRAGTELDMFGWLKDAFSNQAFEPPAEGVRATARHILVKDLEAITEIKAKIDSGEMTMENAARQFSTCPSSAQEGSLGSFKPGMMVPEFDQAVFGNDAEGKRNPVGAVLGPVETKFGFHLIRIESRNMGSKVVNGAFTEETM
jgi:peptidyl-prolyl cis-trans isomerase C